MTALRAIIVGEGKVADYRVDRDLVFKVVAEQTKNSIEEHLRVAHHIVSHYLDAQRIIPRCCDPDLARQYENLFREEVFVRGFGVTIGLTPGVKEIVEKNPLLNTIVLGAFRSNLHSSGYITSVFGMCNSWKRQRSMPIAIVAMRLNFHKIQPELYHNTSQFHLIYSKLTKSYISDILYA